MKEAQTLYIPGSKIAQAIIITEGTVKTSDYAWHRKVNQIITGTPLFLKTELGILPRMPILGIVAPAWM